MNHETPTAKASQLSPAEVKQEILDDDSLSEEEKKVKIDALYAKPRTQKEMPMSRRTRTALTVTIQVSRYRNKVNFGLAVQVWLLASVLLTLCRV